MKEKSPHNFTGVFPAPAGINRPVVSPGCSSIRVPRASGDKPQQIVAPQVWFGCSPRQRG
ncbi:hypothetical protein JGW18_004497 [Salmonella enterica]|nr:hypothetical protein [Salmonella enterica]